MSLRDRYRRLPPSTSGRLRHDVFVGLIDAAVSGVWAMTGNIRQMAAPREFDRTMTLTVADRQVVAHDQHVVALTLTAPDGGRLAPWRAGSHLDIHLPSGLVRQYSLCGDPEVTDAYRIAVRRISDGGGGSIEVHDALPVGATVTTSGPRNAFPLSVPGYGSPSRRLRFIAGGIGITPILPMLNMAARLDVEWSMVFAGRNRDSLPFVEELERFGDRIEIRTDDRSGIPTGEDLLGDCPDNTAVYACGPAPMLTAIQTELGGRDNVELHFERFAAPPVLDGSEFEVTVASSGATVRVAADETLLSALRRDKVTTGYSCQQGFCGTCRTRVLDGAVEHRDTLLTGPERDSGLMLVCISRAAPGGRLTLDL